MSLLTEVICDSCGMLMGSHKNAALARQDARDGCDARTGLPGGQDLCGDCGGRPAATAPAA